MDIKKKKFPPIIVFNCEIFNWATNYDYHYEWPIENAKGMSPEDVMDIFKKNPGSIFPFEITGCDIFINGSVCTLHAFRFKLPLFDSGIAQQFLYSLNDLANGTGTVYVSTTPTSLTFSVARDGYFDPLGSSITFEITQKGEEIFLTQTTNTHGSSPIVTPGVKAGGAAANWFAQSRNLNKLIPNS